MNFDQLTGRLAERYGISEDAVQTMATALERGGGRLAQFRHAELGGSGQWMPGMTQIGEMFNRDLRDRVDRLGQELSEYLQARRTHETAAPGADRRENLSTKPNSMKPMEPMKPMSPMQPMKPMEPMKAPERWWPENLGEHPNSSGGQNETRYAFFGDSHRLAVDTGEGKVQVYDTGDHRISGVQQHQSGGSKKATFTSQHGEVDLSSLQTVS